MAIHSSPGRGRKHCANCGKYVGVRSHTCPNCSASFNAGRSVKVPNRSEVRPLATELIQDEQEIEIDSDSEFDSETDSEASETIIAQPRGSLSSKNHVERVNFLKRELTRELKVLSRQYGKSVIEEIQKSLGLAKNYE